jgi:DNA polymerase-3 subunit alpha
MLGLYVSDHPLMGAEAALKRKCDCSIPEVMEMDEGGGIKAVGGVITSLQRKWTKKGDLMAVFQLEDLQSSIEVMVFPKTMTEIGHKLADDTVVVLKARIDKRDDQPKLIVMDCEVFDGITDGAPPVRIRMAPQVVTETLIGQLKSLLAEFPGESPVFLHVGKQSLRLSGDWCVDAASGVMSELRVLLGPDAVVI